MLIQELRRSIMVTIYGSFWNNRDYAIIGYSINARPQNQLQLQPDDLKRELIAIGTLDENVTDDELKCYHISQWDALNIAIRHELTLETEKQIDQSDIGNAIKNVIK